MNIFSKKIFVFAFIASLLSVSAGPAAAVTIELKSGRIVEGKIVRETLETIEVDVGMERLLKFYRDEISAIHDGKKKEADMIAPPPVVLPTSEGSKTFLWKVTSKNTHAYILGSIHLGKPDMYPLPEQVEKAYQIANALVVEVNVVAMKPEVLQSRLAVRGIYQNGDLLTNHISEETLSKLEKALGAYGTTLAPFRQYKPWYMAMALATLQIKSLGFDEDLGVDMYFLKRALNSKQILELETLREQLDSLDGIKDQDKFLSYSLASLQDIEADLNHFLDVWRNGRISEVEKIILTDALKEDPSAKDQIFRPLLFDRNAAMSEEIMSYLDLKGQVYFIVVGAAHLLGDNGILKILERYGYKVEQL